MQGWRWGSIRGLRFVATAGVIPAWSTSVSFFLFLDSPGLAPTPVARSYEGMGVAGQDVIDEVLYLRSAGLDLGKRFLLACVRIPNPMRQGTWSLETERFGTTPAEVSIPRKRGGLRYAAWGLLASAISRS
jgi:hypothetical protein